VADVIATGRTSRTRTSDLQVAAIAITHGLPLHTIHVDDFHGINDLQLISVRLGGQ
jgi:predicted nucleic acid-binding protein